MKAIEVRAHGGPEVLELCDLPDPEPGPDEVVIDVRAAGVNRVDILMRSGAFHGAVKLPIVPGREAAGVVLAVGAEVTALKPGDPAIVFGARPGCYAERAAAPARRVVHAPAGVPFTSLAVLPTAWISAWHCLRRLAKVQQGDFVLVQGAASGVGDAALQIARHLGGRVIASAGSDDKVVWAKEIGAEWGINYEREDVATAVLAATAGRGADVVLDAVGGRIFPASLKAAGAFGRIISLANVTTEDSVVNTRDFYPKNATIFGFQLLNLTASGAYDPAPDLEELAGLVAEGRLAPHIDRVFQLSEAAAAHRYIEERRNRGKVVLGRLA